MLQYWSFNGIFRIFCTREEYRMNPYSQEYESIPLSRSFAECVIVPGHFLTVNPV